MYYQTYLLKEILKRFSGVLCLSILFLLYACALFAPFLSTTLPSQQNLQKSYHPPTLLRIDAKGLYINRYEIDLQNPVRYRELNNERIRIKLFAKGFPYKLFWLISCERHLLQIEAKEPSDGFYLLGSDGLGRDVFSRLLYGGRISLSIGFIGIAITMVIGFLVGGLAGYFGGQFDFLSMRLVELLMAIPGLYLLIVLRSTLAPHFESNQMFLLIVIILSLIGWAGAARVIRGLSLSLSKNAYILAAEVMGQSTFNILRKHILPNLMSYLLVAAMLSIPAYILGEAALSFLGLGIQEPSTSWGLMLKQAQEIKVFMLNFWWMLLPGVMIVVTVFAFNVLGDILRDIVDPKMRRQ